MINTANYTTYNKNLFYAYLILSRKKRTKKFQIFFIKLFIVIYYINICNYYKSLIGIADLDLNTCKIMRY